MAATQSCSYLAASTNRKETEGWPGPVFANEMGLGWTKLNAVRACSNCRIRHVKCSLIHTGGPCTHCRKRKETCEVLGWRLEPDEASKTIYKYVLPPSRVPPSTPKESLIDAELNQQMDLEELRRRLERLRPRRLASLWPWGPDDHEPYYPMGPQFGKEHPEKCLAHCPTHELDELGFVAPSEHASFSPAYLLEFNCPLSSGMSTQAPFNGEFYGCYHQIEPSGEASTRSHNHPNHQSGINQSKYSQSNGDHKSHRMSLSFLLNAEEM